MPKKVQRDSEQAVYVEVKTQDVEQQELILLNRSVNWYNHLVEQIRQYLEKTENVHNP